MNLLHAKRPVYRILFVPLHVWVYIVHMQLYQIEGYNILNTCFQVAVKYVCVKSCICKMYWSLIYYPVRDMVKVIYLSIF